MQYFFANGNEQKGPYSLEEIAAIGLRSDTLVWREGMPEWRRADAIPELVAATTTSTKPAVLVEMPAIARGPQPPLNYHTITHHKPTDGLAVASLVLGIISLPGLCLHGLGLIPAILAIIFGFIARSRIKRGRTEGAAMALVGLLCGLVTLAIVFFGVLLIGFGVAMSK